MVAGLDHSIGEIVRVLQARNMDKNTILIFTTDNGGATAGFNRNHASNWPLRGGKDTLWEGGVRGTAFIWSPLLHKIRRVSNQMMHITDWLPTLLSAAGIHNLPPLDGIDMWSALSNNLSSPRSEVLLNIDRQRGIYGLRVKNYKILIGSTYNGTYDGWYGPKAVGYQNTSDFAAQILCDPPHDPKVRGSCEPSKRPCLLDLEIDPCEYRNLATEKPEILAKMMIRLREHNATVVPARNRRIDDAGRPVHHENIWSPWIL